MPTKRDVIVSKLDALRDALSTELLRREVEIDCVLLALVSGQHFFMLGTPGEAKTFLGDRTAARIAGVRHFSEQMRKTLPPEALFGPISVPALKQERWKHMTDGYLPWADMACIDEIWKGSASVLNNLLGIMLERRMKNDGTVQVCPLSTVICASNEMPDNSSESLAAIWDRILLRREVQSLTDESDLRALVTLPAADPNPPAVIDWADILEAKALAADVALTDDAMDAYMLILRALADAGIRPTPRRIRIAPVVAQAAAFLAGADKVEPEHLEPFAHVFWDKPEQIHTVDRLVSATVAPGQAEALALSDAVAELVEALDTTLDRSAA
jgi:MoxR-like ATPase